jgi:hypothetical protein
MSTSCQSSDLKAASALISTGRNRINSVSLIGDGTNACTLTLYDNTSAAGKVAAVVRCRTTDQQNHIIFTFPISMENGIYASLGGVGGNYIVYYGG